MVEDRCVLRLINDGINYRYLSVFVIEIYQLPSLINFYQFPSHYQQSQSTCINFSDRKC